MSHAPVRDSSRRDIVLRMLLIGSIAGLLAFVNRRPIAGLLQAGQVPAETLLPRPIEPREELLPEELATVRLFEKTSPSVVYVSTIRRLPTLLNRTIEEGTGSGFIWDRFGHVVTNFHVVAKVYGDQQRRIEVTLRDGRTLAADLVGVAADKDLAVMKLRAQPEELAGLIPISVGSSAELRIGQRALAIGNPLGLDYTLTQGIVSALGREIESLTGRKIQGVIQTDAAINRGNSGGPLLDSAGRLIGVNTQIRADGQSIGFAIPVDTVNKVVPLLIKNGGLRAGLGCEFVPTRVAKMNGIHDGVIVGPVYPKTAAERAGFRGPRVIAAGELAVEVITAIDGVPVNSVEKLESIFENKQVGDKVKITFRQDGRLRQVEVALQAVE
jgi:S1-C subfamily serine protease